MNTVPESHRDLLASDVAVLATIGPDGYPQVTAQWFLLDEDGALKLSLNTAGSGATELVVQRAGQPRPNPQRVTAEHASNQLLLPRPFGTRRDVPRMGGRAANGLGNHAGLPQTGPKQAASRRASASREETDDRA